MNCVREHIRSFKGRKSHYGLKKTEKLYLPEDLNVKKMHNMYCQKFLDCKVSYETYRKIFVNNFNISFGFPRSDTCSICDQHLAKTRSLKLELKNQLPGNETEMSNLEKQLTTLNTENKLHKLKADTFYKRKRAAKNKSMQSEEFEAITMDFAKNLPMPNITTNDVYYKRQLTFISFNIHLLGCNDVIFYTYPQTIAKKGADNVASLLNHFCFEVLSPTVRHLEIFCDSCAGQNKNYTIFRFLHYLIQYKGRFESVKVTFPIRGHSYMESDKDFGLINQKSVVEVPSQWVKVFRNSRVKPTPFKVIDCKQELFIAWTKYLTPLFKKTSPFQTRPIKELFLSLEHPRTIKVRNSYNGTKESFVITNAKTRCLPTIAPQKLYEQLIPLPKKKFDQLQELKVFLSDPNQLYYENLPFSGRDRDSDGDGDAEV